MQVGKLVVLPRRRRPAAWCLGLVVWGLQLAAGTEGLPPLSLLLPLLLGVWRLVSNGRRLMLHILAKRLGGHQTQQLLHPSLLRSAKQRRAPKRARVFKRKILRRTPLLLLSKAGKLPPLRAKGAQARGARARPGG